MTKKRAKKMTDADIAEMLRAAPAVLTKEQVEQHEANLMQSGIGVDRRLTLYTGTKSYVEMEDMVKEMSAEGQRELMVKVLAAMHRHKERSDLASKWAETILLRFQIALGVAGDCEAIWKEAEATMWDHLEAEA